MMEGRMGVTIGKIRNCLGVGKGKTRLIAGEINMMTASVERQKKKCKVIDLNKFVMPQKRITLSDGEDLEKDDTISMQSG